MTHPNGGRALYTPAILELAMELANYPVNADFAHRGEAASRVCGSRVAIGLNTDRDGRIERIGAKVTACAIGQAASALFLRSARGLDAAALNAAQRSIAAWLAGADPVPEWEGIAVLDAARSYPARHPAILLPWNAALAALSNPPHAD